MPEALRGRARRSKPEVLEITWARFDELAHLIARAAQDFAPEAVVGVAKGGVFVGGAVASALKVEFFPVRISRRSRDSAARSPAISGSMPEELAGLRVLIVDDVAASGETLRLAKRLARAAGAKKVRTASLAIRTSGFKPDYHALEADEIVVFPWDYEGIAAP